MLGDIKIAGREDVNLLEDRYWRLEGEYHHLMR